MSGRLRALSKVRERSTRFFGFLFRASPSLFLSHCCEQHEWKAEKSLGKWRVSLWSWRKHRAQECTWKMRFLFIIFFLYLIQMLECARCSTTVDNVLSYLCMCVCVCVCVQMCVWWQFDCSPIQAVRCPRDWSVFPIPIHIHDVCECVCGGYRWEYGTIALCAACRYFVTSSEAIVLIILVFSPSPLSHYYNSSQTLLLQW